jgi:amino acid adenylation domain-containing protein
LLAGRGAGPERVVAMLLPRGAEMIVAVLAVLKAGAAYLPIDPDYPPGRIEYLLRDARPMAVVTTAELTGCLPEDSPPPVVLDDPDTGEQLAASPTTSPTATPLPGNAAYLIYTSGSTGTPKGVLITHRNVVNLAAWAVAELGEEAFSRVLGAASLSFDMSVFEILVPLMAGGAIDLVRNLLSLLDLPNWSGSLINAPPSIYQRVVQADWVRERSGTYFFCGEPLSGDLVRQVHARAPGAAVFNIYGPTEATVYATAWRCADGSAQDPPIGVPITNMRCHVLDSALRPVPPDHAGELYLAGDYLARGYANRPALTAQRFVADPFGPPGGRMYRTGDVVRWTGAGELRFVGRVDNQVKVRGIRVELGEIEAALTARPDIVAAAVVATGDGNGDRRLTAYVVAAGGHQPRPDAVAAGLRAALPDPLVPSAIVVRDALPLNAAGKLDRLALAADARTAARGTDTAVDHVVEDRVGVLCAVFAGVLGRAAGPRDSFFALGGDSMRSIKLVRRARQAGLVISPEDVFERQTPAALAACARPLAGPPVVAPAGPPLDVLLPVRRSGTRPPMFCVHPVAGVGWLYSALVRQLGAEYPIYALQARGLAADEALPASVEEMSADYVAEIRRVQPAGPYHLLGWSFGGLAAHAMATHLQDQGHEVGLLAMMDSYVPADLPVAPRVAAIGLRRAVLAALLGFAGIRPAGLRPEDLTTARFLEIVRRTDSVLSGLGDDRLIAMAGVYENNVRLGAEFRPRAFRGDVTFFAARQDGGEPPMRPDMWRRYVTDGEIHMHHSEFAHDDMGRPESMAEVGRIVAAALRSKG